MVEVAEGAGRPEALLEFFAGDDATAGGDEQNENVEGLARETNADASAAQLAGVFGEFEVSKTERLAGGLWGLHEEP
jgi:hypothetical protein